MNLSFLHSPLEQVPGEILWLFHFEDQLLPRGALARVDWILNGLISQLLYRGKFRGFPLETLLLSTSGKFSVEKALVLGLGKRAELNEFQLREAYSSAAEISARVGAAAVILTIPQEAFPIIAPQALRELMPTILNRMVLAGMNPGDITLALYEKDPEENNRWSAYLKEVTPGAEEMPSASPSLA